MVVLYANWMDSLVNNLQRAEIQGMFALKMFEVFSGYRLGTILCEEIGGVIRNFRKATHVWRVVQQFREHDRALICLSRADALNVAGSVYGELFRYREPTLKFRSGEKQLLIAARDGATDSQLATTLNLSLAAVKKRWRAIFDRIVLKRPDLLPVSARQQISEVRGPQKRHFILAYVRQHPEELRPFDNSD
jgi:hypothetical protein